MSEHKATIEWKRETDNFDYDHYNRRHKIIFNENIVLKASAAEGFKGDPKHVDPEQALVASISSCHMLTFLAISSKKGYIVDEYQDQAVGIMEKDQDGYFIVARATLSPDVRFSGSKIPSAEEINKLHTSAHKYCVIANSVKTVVTVTSKQIIKGNSELK